MGIRSYKRVFKDNNHYGDSKILYLKSLAYTVQEYLYTDGVARQTIVTAPPQASEAYFDCQMDSRIQLFDFMNFVYAFLQSCASDFAKAELNDYIGDLQLDCTYKKDSVYYMLDNDFRMPHASNEVIVAILWATWIYFKVLYELTHDEKYVPKIALLNNYILDNYPYSESYLKEHPIFSHADDAVKTMLQHIGHEKENENEKEKELAADVSLKQNSRIKELEEENTRLKNSIALLKEHSPEEKWLACFDGFLHPNLNAQAIAQALEKITTPQLPKNERGYWWAFYTVLTEIHWIPYKNHKMALQWANLHFDCGWDWLKDNQFKFTDIASEIRAVPSKEWNENTMKTNTGMYYGELAKTFRDTFIEIVNGDKLMDRASFIKSGCQRINNGR